LSAEYVLVHCVRCGDLHELELMAGACSVCGGLLCVDCWDEDARCCASDAEGGR
jgi:hypothetical protein